MVFSSSIGVEENNDDKKKLLKTVVSGGVHKDDSSHSDCGSDTTNSDMTHPTSLMQINPNAVFGIIPSGTRNVLVKSLDLPAESEECCNTMRQVKYKKRLMS
jgi:hypothetical protein